MGTNENFEDSINNELSAEVVVQGLSKVSKEVKESMVKVTRNEARFLVDTYYQMQAARITADGQIRSIVQSADDQNETIPLALKWVSENMRNQEVQIKVMLEKYVGSLPVGKWALATKGIGPVLAAGCLSNFDINKVNHYGQFISFCGLNDYNNPWLGVEKAKAMVKEIYKELEESDKKFAGCSIPEDEGKKLLSAMAKEESFGQGQTYSFCKKNKKLEAMYTELFRMSDEDIDTVEDYIVRHYVKNDAVTNKVIQMVMTRTTRRRAVIVNGLNNAVHSKKTTSKSKKDLQQWSKNNLASYLAKPPYNKNAKQLVYLIGESFVKQSGKPSSLYGRLYLERKAYEVANNEKGVYAPLAEEALASKNYGKDTSSYQCYVEGKLPPAQIHNRSKRYAVKIFISHLFEAMYMDKYHCKVPYEIYPIAHMEHTDYIPPEVPYEKYIKINK